jgi:hypothetical protein
MHTFAIQDNPHEESYAYPDTRDPTYAMQEDTPKIPAYAYACRAETPDATK